MEKAQIKHKILTDLHRLRFDITPVAATITEYAQQGEKPFDNLNTEILPYRHLR